MIRKLLAALVLPAQISAFERRYLARMNRVAFVFFALHVPALALLASVNHTRPMLAAGLSSLVMVGPVLAYLGFRNPRNVSLVFGFSSMLMGGLLAHFGQGQVQIEMHFYFFALLAMLAVFANPMVIVTAAVTVAIHHLGGWALLPASVFNYAAPLWVVAVHAGFVVLESVATCFIARVFFDNVIGLEKIVEARTAQLDVCNRDMRLVLDHVQQGLLTIDRNLAMSNERSMAVEALLGPCEPGQGFVDYLARSKPSLAAAFAMAWEQVLADFLPLELTLEQLPSTFSLGQRHFRLEYTPIMRAEQLDQLLVVISDVSSEVENERLEMEQRDVMQILGRVADDKAGVLEFFQESADQVAEIARGGGDARLEKRVIHTLKGNSMIFGVQTIARQCERMESQLDEQGLPPSEEERRELSRSWTHLCERLALVLGERDSKSIEIDDAEYAEILAAVLRGAPRELVAAQIRSWRLEPAKRRLLRIGEQARALAKRTGKGDIDVKLDDNEIRLDPKRWSAFWASFVHVVRNAVDHGLESDDDRAAAHKPRAALYLSTRMERGDLVISLSDNGRGVDWKRVAEKARERGLPNETRGDLVEALFHDGLSTRSEAGEYSGRGVGMSAVRASCVQNGGSVTVQDRTGGGTTVEFRFPGSSDYVVVRPNLAQTG